MGAMSPSTIDCLESAGIYRRPSLNLIGTLSLCLQFINVGLCNLLLIFDTQGFGTWGNLVLKFCSIIYYVSGQGLPLEDEYLVMHERIVLQTGSLIKCVTVFYCLFVFSVVQLVQCCVACAVWCSLCSVVQRVQFGAAYAA